MAAPTVEVSIAPLPDGFDRWQELLDLILAAFRYMDGVIDPPSSAHRLTPAALKEKCMVETVFVAFSGAKLAGCVFLADRGNVAYVGKLAVEPALQGTGIGRRLMATAEAAARLQGKQALELQTRVELEGNHTVFERFGFRQVMRTAHAGYKRPTSVTMRKELGPGA